MNKIKKPILLLSILCLAAGLVACKKDKGDKEQQTDNTNTEIASNDSNDSVLRPSGTIKPNASTISLFIKTYNDNKDKETGSQSDTTPNTDSNSKVGDTENTTQDTTNTNNPLNKDTESDTKTAPDANAAETNTNPGSTVPETTDQSSIDLPYGGNPQAVKEKAAADAKEDEGKFELRSQEKLKEGKDENKK